MLIIADDAYLVNVVRAALQIKRIQLVVASTEAVAMRALSTHYPDLVLLGVDSIGLQGKALFTKITKADADVPVIAMSDQAEQAAAYRDAVDFVQTPVTTARIKRAALQALARSPPGPRQED